MLEHIGKETIGKLIGEDMREKARKPFAHNDQNTQLQGETVSCFAHHG